MMGFLATHRCTAKNLIRGGGGGGGGRGGWGSI